MSAFTIRFTYFHVTDFYLHNSSTKKGHRDSSKWSIRMCLCSRCVRGSRAPVFHTPNVNAAAMTIMVNDYSKSQNYVLLQIIYEDS
jgi:hypothetical protein